MMSIVSVRGADAGHDLGFGQLTFVEVLVHQLFAGLGSGLDHERARRLGLVEQARPGCRGTRTTVPWIRSCPRWIAFILSRSTTPSKPSSAPIGTCIGTGYAPRRDFSWLDDLVEVGAGAVHLVDERKARHGVLVGLAPDGLGLRLHAADRAQHEHRAVEHAQRTLDFDGEVDVSRGYR